MMAPETPPLLKVFMDDCVCIYREFQQLDIPGREQWLYDRYSEVRKMVKVQLKEIEQKS